MDGKTRIFVFTYPKAAGLAEFDGRFRHATVLCGAKSVPRDAACDYRDDDGPDTISELNGQLSEVTGIWWIWKNADRLFKDVDFIGTAHYRRRLQPPDGWIPSAGRIACCRMDFMTSVAVQYMQCHPVAPMRGFMRELGLADPELAGRINGLMLGKKFIYKANMFIMPRRLFVEYGKFIDACVNACLNVRLAGIAAEAEGDLYQRRWMGFIIERMTSCWLQMASEDGLAAIDEVPAVDFDIPNTINSTR